MRFPLFLLFNPERNVCQKRNISPFSPLPSQSCQFRARLRFVLCRSLEKGRNSPTFTYKPIHSFHSQETKAVFVLDLFSCKQQEANICRIPPRANEAGIRAETDRCPRHGRGKRGGREGCVLYARPKKGESRSTTVLANPSSSSVLSGGGGGGGFLPAADRRLVWKTAGEGKRGNGRREQQQRAPPSFSFRHAALRLLYPAPHPVTHPFLIL